mmetsp:Transcript_9821/g.17445  ORF Transcript_9821/g.17445 Transcript_9821/m.17445 type:complete len:95 (+) Transcript_9821:37-321(+)
MDKPIYFRTQKIPFISHITAALQLSHSLHIYSDISSDTIAIFFSSDKMQCWVSPQPPPLAGVNLNTVFNGTSISMHVSAGEFLKYATSACRTHV